MSVSVLQLRYELNNRVVAKDHSTTFDIWDANERRASLSPGKGKKKKSSDESRASRGQTWNLTAALM